MKKVCYVSHYPTLSMGGQRSMAGLIEHLDRSRFEPYAIVPEPGELSERLKELDCRVIFIPLFAMKPKYAHKLPREYVLLRKAIRDHKFDIIHPDSQSDAYMCHLARKGTKTKLFWHVRLTAPKKNDKIHFYVADAIIGVSDGAGRRFNRFKDFETKYRTIYNGVYTNIFKPANREETRRKLDLPIDRNIILFAGIYKDGKGIYDLAEAFSIIRKEDQDLADRTLLIYHGQTPDEEKFRQFTDFVKERDKKNNVLILPPVPNIHEHMQAADILTIPSHEGIEGMPRVSYEAMACGIPVVGTDTSGVNESITPETGIIVPEKSPEELANALIKLLNDVELRNKMGIAGRERVLNEFSIESHARKVEQFYEEILAG